MMMPKLHTEGLSGCSRAGPPGAEQSEQHVQQQRFLHMGASDGQAQSFFDLIDLLVADQGPSMPPARQATALACLGGVRLEPHTVHTLCMLS